MVTKPFAPPWHDSSSGLARALVTGLLDREDAPALRVMVGSHPSGLSGLTEERIYRDAGNFAPGLRQNLPVLLRLLRAEGERGRHFFFAPNPRTAMAARCARWICRRPSVHTLCSLPAVGVDVKPSLFAERHVVVSPWAQRRLAAEGVEAQLIEPAVLPLESSDAGRARCRERFGDYVLFAGDWRAGGGAEVALAVAQQLPDGLNLVLACRAKTPADEQRRAVFERRLREGGFGHVHVLGRIDWIGDLVSAARAQLLPATDLTGKMDWPLVVLEGFAAGVPAVVADNSPMADLDEPVLASAPIADVSAVTQAVERMAALDRDEARSVYARRFTPKRMAKDYASVYRDLGLM
jgi:glycosyltransferase involved in cell wall biosynthesis